MIYILSFYSINFDYNNIIFDTKLYNNFFNFNYNNNNSSLLLLYNICNIYLSIIKLPDYIINKYNNFKLFKELDYIKIKKFRITKIFNNPKIFKNISEKYNFNNKKIVNTIINNYYIITCLYNNIIDNDNFDLINNININTKSSNDFNNIIRCFLHVYPYYGYLDGKKFYDFNGVIYMINDFNYKKLINIIKCDKCFISYISKDIEYNEKDNLTFINLICPNVVDKLLICDVLFVNLNINSIVFDSIYKNYNLIYPKYINKFINQDIKYHIEFNNTMNSNYITKKYI